VNLPPPLRSIAPERLGRAFGALVAAGAPAAVLLVDLDRAHLLGAIGADLPAPGLSTALYAALDRCLRGVAPWVRVESDLVAVLSPNVADLDAAADLAGQVLLQLDKAAELSGDTVLFRPCIGVAWQQRPTPELFRRAAAACARARHGTDRVVLLDGSRLDIPATATDATDVTDAGAAALASVTARHPLDDFLVRVSTTAMSQSPARFLSRLDATLGELGTLLGVDYVFVDVMGSTDDTVTNFAGWCAPSHRGFIRTESRVISDDDPWHDMLHRLEPVVVVDQFASHDGQHPGNHPSGGVSQAFVTVPFVASNRLAGALGAGTIERPYPWSEDEVTTLRLATGLIAGVIERNRVEIEHRAGAR
jgi:GAF domain-containing protein